MVRLACKDRDNARVRLRAALLRACASVALVTIADFGLAAPFPAAFQAHLIGSQPSVVRIATSHTTETIIVNSHVATLNWVPVDLKQGGGAIDFLPAGNVATFTSAPGITDYIVLNRILPADPSRPISLNGELISTLQGTSAIGGRIWFLSPGGIVVGATAVFNLGSLLLTTNHVSDLSMGSGGFSARFTSPGSPTAAIRIMDGAKINALQPGSYVAMIAPRIEQGGTVGVNGSAAYAAGEELRLTLNQGLFDIEMHVGTTDSNGVIHTGETSGPSGSTAAASQRIYMVAVPKNQALTMLLGGNIGFDATNAEVQNGQIILTSGGNIELTGGKVSSSLTASATLSNDGSVFVNGNVRFVNARSGESLTINASKNIEVNTDTGSIMMFGEGNKLGGKLTLNAANIWVAQRSILTQLEANPNYQGRDAALAVNSGVSNLNGFVGADTVVTSASSSLFGQNSGTSRDMAGITAGAGGFSIAATGAGTAMVNVYGRQTTNGTSVTGTDFFKAVGLSGTFINGSMINGCEIGSPCRTISAQILRDELVTTVRGEDATKKKGDSVLIDVTQLTSANDDIRQIDIGVTSGADSSEWDPIVIDEDKNASQCAGSGSASASTDGAPAACGVRPQ